LAASDNFSLRITFADGSVGTVNYAADAPTGPGKERFEVSAPGSYGLIDDFRRGAIWRGARRQSLGGRHQDKGFASHFELIRKVLCGQAEAPSPATFYVSTLATLAAARSLETGQSERIVAAEDRPEVAMGPKGTE